MGENVLMAGAPSGMKLPDGIPTLIERVGQQGERSVSQLHGKMYEQALRLNLFHAASQADTTTTIALATTYTGFCLSNPAGNTKLLVPRQIGIALCLAPAAEANMAIGGGYAAAGVATHTTALATYSAMLGNGVAATGLADAACTLPAGAGDGLLRVITQCFGAFTAAALPSTTPMILDLDGSIIIPAGGFIFIYTLTVVHGFFSMNWEEIPA